MGVGFHLCGENVSGNIFGLIFLCKNDRNIKILRCDAGNADTGGFDGQDLVDAGIRETAVKLFADFFKQVDIHLMIQKAVYFEDISFFNDSVFANSFFQKLHSFLLLI